MIQGLKQELGIDKYNSTSRYEKNSEKTNNNENSNSTDKLLGKDTFEKSEPTEKLTYTKSDIENKAKDTSASEEVNRLIEENERKQEEFKQLIKSLISKQGDSYNLILFGQKLNVTPEIAQKAKESISDGGEYSVDSVATNIMNMAKALSGGNSSNIGELKEGFLKGFKEAEKAWGGKLPEISQKTYDEVLKRFDEWENESKQQSIEK